MTKSEIFALAMQCVVQNSDLPATHIEPVWFDRRPTTADRKLTNASDTDRVVGIYIPRGIGTMIASSRNWPVLVHEVCHHLQHLDGIYQTRASREAECYLIQNKAGSCEKP